MDCIQQYFIKTYNCFDMRNGFNIIRWKRDLIENNFKFCNNMIIINKNDAYININKCVENCRYDCLLILSKVTSLKRESSLYMKKYETTVKILPKSDLILEYREKYVMDVMELIYQLGGCVGMYVGWSIITISEIHMVTHILEFFDKFGKILKLVFSLVVQCLRSWCKLKEYFLNKLKSCKMIGFQRQT